MSSANVNELVKLEKSQLPKAKNIQPHRMAGRGYGPCYQAHSVQLICVVVVVFCCWFGLAVESYT